MIDLRTYVNTVIGMRRKRLRQLYVLRETTNPSTGRTERLAVYTGAYYRFSQPTAAERLHLLHIMDFAFALCAAAFVGYGFMDLPSTRSYLVLPFYLAMGLPLFFWGRAIWRVWRLPPRFTQVQREGSVRAGIRSARGIAVLCGLFVTGEALLLMTGQTNGSLPAEIGWAGGMAACGATAVWSARAARALDDRAVRVPEPEPEPEPEPRH